MKIKMDYLGCDIEVDQTLIKINMGECSIEEALKWLYVQGMVDKELESLDKTIDGGYIAEEIWLHNPDYIEVDLVEWNDVYDEDGNMK